MSIRSHSRIAKLAGISAIAATALVAAPVSLAATTGGASVTASAARVKSAPFTLGVSATTVRPGQKITISGLAYARAGKNLTIASPAISSARTAVGMPAVQTPALVEGIYHTTVRVPPATQPGVYPVILRFGNRQVASINNLRVISAGSRTAKTARVNACDGISFRVLNNDNAGNAYMPAGRYKVSSANMDCGTASADFTGFLAGAGKQIPGWSATSTGAAGHATFTQRNSGLSFSVAKVR
jgi:hypothetical protein